jgi:restriction system protein
MARRSSFVSLINAVARDAARHQRQAEAERKRYERALVRTLRDRERMEKLQTKEDKQRYLEARIEETEDQNAELTEQIESLKTVLEQTLSVDDTITFDSLRIRDEYVHLPTPQELTIAKLPPDKQEFLSKVKTPGLLEGALGLKGRYQRDLQAAETQYEAARKAYEQSESERQARLQELHDQDEVARQAFLQKTLQRNQEVDDLEAAYQNADISAVITYNSMVLERSEYPEEFPQNFRLAHAPESKELVIEYELPAVGIVPDVAEYKYTKSKDAIEGKPRKSAEIKEVYQDIVASITLRSIHEVLEADQGHHLEVVVFNGFVQTVDAATGKDIRPCLISVRTTREQFSEINLARVDKRACLRNLGAHVSPQPHTMQPVKPVVEFDMVDKRFIDQGDVLGELESRPNLMDLSPTEFETLVSNLFQKMGLETKLTRASRDGGVDAVAFDTRPVLGGKVVIQAKRYKNTVGVSAVRDLYGTMLNEGANKGIIVATSSYGPDAYDFAKDKPIECIDGGGLLYLLDQAGIKARIVIPDESR